LKQNLTLKTLLLQVSIETEKNKLVYLHLRESSQVISGCSLSYLSKVP